MMMDGTPSAGAKLFTSLFTRRLMLWFFAHMALLSIFLYASSLAWGTGHRDLLCTVMIFASFFLLNMMWFFDMGINADLEVWMRIGMNWVLFPTLTMVTCSSAAVMLGIFFDYRYPVHEFAVSSANLVFCAFIHTSVITDRYKSGGLADVVIESPLEDASAKYRRAKKTDNAERVWGNDEDDTNNDNGGNALGWTWAYVHMVLRNEIVVSLRYAAVISLVTVACITVCRHAITDMFCDPEIVLLSTLFCPNYTSYNYLSMVYQITSASVMLQVFPLLMLTSLKKLLFSPITFIATPNPTRGSIESTASLRNSQSNYARVSNQPSCTLALTSGMLYGVAPMQRLVKFSWMHQGGSIGSESYNGGGLGTQGQMADSTIDRGGGVGGRDERGLSTPRWQEALFVYRAIAKELLSGLRVSYLGPPLVAYLNGGGGGFIFGNKRGHMSGRARLQTLTRSLAMNDFARVAAADSPGLSIRRRQLFLESWGDACVAALTFVSATTLQIQLITCHAMETVLKPQPHWTTYYDKDGKGGSKSGSGSGNGTESRSRGDSRGGTIGGDAFKFNQIMGGHFQAKNLDRTVSIPEAVVDLVRRGKDRVDRSIFGFVGNAIMASRWFGWMWPLIKLIFARYPFSGSLPPFVLQTCINAVRGVSYGLVKSLTDDPTGMAHYHLIGSMEILIRLELSLEEFEVCMARCQVNMLAKLKKVKKVDAKSLQIEVGDAIDRLVGAFRDVLSRQNCPLLQDDIVGPVLLARIKTMR